MKNESLVTQRIGLFLMVYNGGYLKVKISQDMLCYVLNSQKAYENAKEENHGQTETEKQKVEKKRLSVQLKKVKEGKK